MVWRNVALDDVMMTSFGVMSFGLDLIPHVMSSDNYDVMMVP